MKIKNKLILIALFFFIIIFNTNVFASDESDLKQKCLDDFSTRYYLNHPLFYFSDRF